MSEKELNEEGIVVQYRLLMLLASNGSIQQCDLPFPSVESARNFRHSVKNNLLNVGYSSHICKETLKYGVRFKYEDIND
jgi:hypothetical protein